MTKEQEHPDKALFECHPTKISGYNILVTVLATLAVATVVKAYNGKDLEDEVNDAVVRCFGEDDGSEGYKTKKDAFLTDFASKYDRASYSPAHGMTYDNILPHLSFLENLRNYQCPLMRVQNRP